MVEVKLSEEQLEELATKVASKLNSSPIKEQKVYSAQQVAKILNCHKITVYNYIKSKRLKASHKGKGFLITEEALKQFLDEKV